MHICVHVYYWLLTNCTERERERNLELGRESAVFIHKIIILLNEKTIIILLLGEKTKYVKLLSLNLMLHTKCFQLLKKDKRLHF